MSLWAKFKNYFFGVPLPQPAAPVVEQKQPEPVVVKEEPKQIDLKLDEVKQEATLTVAPAPSVEVAPAEPVKKKAPAKKRTTKKKSN